jgi:hypothetical protein
MSQLDNDPVNHPSHYTQGGVECIEAIEAALGLRGFISFLRGQVIKYNWRLESKEHPVQDAEKAQWYGALLVKKLKEDAEEPKFRRQDDVKVVPTTQGEALTEKKAQSHEHLNRNSSTFSADVARFYACPNTGYSRRICGCASCVALRAPYRSQP